MYLIYGEAHCVSARVARLYAERYSNRMHPDCKTFERLDRRIRNSNCLKPAPKVDTGCNRRIRTIGMEERIVEIVVQDSTYAN
jgi:hypothetical protein